MVQNSDTHNEGGFEEMCNNIPKTLCSKCIHCDEDNSSWPTRLEKEWECKSEEVPQNAPEYSPLSGRRINEYHLCKDINEGECTFYVEQPPYVYKAPPVEPTFWEDMRSLFSFWRW